MVGSESFGKWLCRLQIRVSASCVVLVKLWFWPDFKSLFCMVGSESSGKWLCRLRIRVSASCVVPVKLWLRIRTRSVLELKKERSGTQKITLLNAKRNALERKKERSGTLKGTLWNAKRNALERKKERSGTQKRTLQLRSKWKLSVATQIEPAYKFRVFTQSERMSETGRFRPKPKIMIILGLYFNVWKSRRHINLLCYGEIIRFYVWSLPVQAPERVSENFFVHSLTILPYSYKFIWCWNLYRLKYKLSIIVIQILAGIGRLSVPFVTDWKPVPFMWNLPVLAPVPVKANLPVFSIYTVLILP